VLASHSCAPSSHPVLWLIRQAIVSCYPEVRDVVCSDGDRDSQLVRSASFVSQVSSMFILLRYGGVEMEGMAARVGRSC
jgi:hypothetical protein